MTDYTELVKALRWCSVDECVPCTGCPMDEETHGTGCFNIMHQRAAAAIEDLQAMLTEADKKQAYQRDYVCELVAEVEELKAQLPKRGEWVGVSPMVDTVQCSVCGGELFSAELETPYCPYCGAKMEVQE